MKLYTQKILLGIIVVATVVILPIVGNLQMLDTPQLWIMAIIGIVASFFQPSYNPFKKSVDKEDRGTALQIIWSIYITQIITIAEATYLRFPESMHWDYITTIALVVMLVGLILRSWAVTTLGGQFTWHIDRKTSKNLIKTGPFRFLRHPGYAGALLTYTFSALFLHAWFSVAINFIVLIIAFTRRIYFEEAVLMDIFGIKYSEYCKKVRKMIPLIW
ncbi:MAG: hypothetical protein COU40_01795 [Candidatus Moranbacteria bacterium CG10_big_fil_rev_8_21_14_0_10_35_21]|nr:MAG: hypothetical protein COU40_01795 [Candidatus Moranbacteria bacterium CG10_big_fil_rev_8_21_14_0_10_35_21]PJA88965.1 MAG: hypothetical protein CO139_00275 [Candidatus Moranbacteria bacterium CG_4_9_14_3_um_filter_36_9]